MARRQHITSLPPPFLKHVWLPDDIEDAEIDWAAYPFSLPILKAGAFDLRFDKAVTIIVGENGTGKSTIIEAIAQMAGFSDSGGGQRMNAVTSSPYSASDGGALGHHLRGSWLPQVKRGWFFRAETFFSVARYLDESGSPAADYLSASHGEGFLAFFEERMAHQGIYFLDEPESALSPQRQFEFLKVLRRIQYAKSGQIIMATHSPILMALPDADLRQIDAYGIRPTTLEQTAHYQIYREFALYPHETVEAMIE